MGNIIVSFLFISYIFTTYNRIILFTSLLFYKMCLTFFISRPSTNPLVKFIIGFNREEQTLRETLPLGKFQEDQNIFGGRDIKSGGTWLGLNASTELLVFLTNYDLPPPTVRMGKSRGQLVHRILSTSFLKPGCSTQQADGLIKETLNAVGRQGKEYSPFNLTVYNLRSGKAFYMCSEWGQKNPLILDQNMPYGICNCDILTIWPKTAHGMSMFKSLLAQLDQLNQEQILASMGKLFKDNKRFSQIDDDQASIFVQPYWCKLQKAQRMTKSTFMLMAVQNQGKLELIFKEITYHRNDNTQTEVAYRLPL